MGGMILIGIIFAAFTGRIPEITDAALDSSKEAGDTLHYDDRRHGILDGIDGNCVEGRDD